eukprot:m.1194727 g.1194727  ORF g.1194727 m.1194727 type:complete len:110 (-) comp24562_c1_seq28:3533-3862(-)
MRAVCAPGYIIIVQVLVYLIVPSVKIAEVVSSMIDACVSLSVLRGFLCVYVCHDSIYPGIGSSSPRFYRTHCAIPVSFVQYLLLYKGPQPGGFSLWVWCECATMDMGWL